VTSLLEERKRLERDLTDARRKLAAGGGGASGEAEFKDVNGIKVAARVLEDVLPKDLKPTADELKKQIGTGVIVLIADTDGKASIVVAVTDDLTTKISAVDLVRAGSAALGGKGGGGRPDMAQAGGPDASKAQDAIKAIEALLG